MKRFTAFALALTLFAAPTVGLAAEKAAEKWDGPSLQDIFGDNYEETIVFGGD